MKQIIIFITVITVAILFVGCGNTPNPAANSNGANTNTTNANNPLETKKSEPEQTVNTAPTLSPMFKAYCAAMNKKDGAAIRKFYSTDTLKVMEEQMKADDVKTLVKFLELEKYEKTCEIRNEEIKGDTAVAEIRSDSMPNGIKIVFVKENGEWKLTNKSPTLDNMKPSATNTNTAK